MCKLACSGACLYGPFINSPIGRNRAFTRACLIDHAATYRWQKGTMSDILIVVLGTGGILLMAAYALLCDRI